VRGPRGLQYEEGGDCGGVMLKKKTNSVMEGRYTMPISIEQAAIDLAVAGGLSSLIGFERQWRNRLAGLRTNTLVALGAASFVIFEGLIPGEASPARVAAQVVSGIGFLGAGLIFREGLSVRGLNTAATIWCSAAVGGLAGAGLAAYAALTTAFVLFVNLLLRPIVMFINKQPLMGAEVEVGYLVSVTCRNPDEAHVRALLLQGLAGAGLALRRLDSNDVETTGRVAVTALMTASHRVDADVERIVGRLSLEPTVSAARWQAEMHFDSEGRPSLAPVNYPNPSSPVGT
jgi:putative Mg2+ transporter-C (MgtC) family protein